MITFEFDGTEYTGFEEATIIKSIEALCGEFFVTFSPGVTPFPIKCGQTAIAKIDNIPIVTGFVEDLDGEADATGRGHRIVVSGRDKVADLDDSTLSEELDYTFPIQLDDVARLVIESLGADIDVINEVPDLEPFNDFVSDSVGTGAFEFLEAHANKRQVLIGSNGNGNLVIRRGSTEPTGVILQNKKTGNQNNIKAINWRVSTRQRFNKYIAHSQGNPTNRVLLTLLREFGPQQLQDVQGQAIDSAIRKTRVKHYITSTSSDAEESQKTANWYANLQRARSITYNAIVQGFYAIPNELIWQPNLNITLIDEFADINSDVLVESVIFNQTLSGGSTTKISLVSPDAYQVNPEASREQEQTSTLEDEFFDSLGNFQFD